MQTNPTKRAKLHARDQSRDIPSELTLRNDVLVTTIAQLVIDIAGELSARRDERFDSYREAIRNLGNDSRFASGLTSRLEHLAGFRKVVVHEYVGIDDSKVIQAVDELAPVTEYLEIVRRIEAGV